MADLKFGRKPPKQAPALRLAPLLTGVIPAHPSGADYLAALPGWKMLGNDQYGDCVAVTWANIRRLISLDLGGVEHYPTFADVEAVYRTQNPGFPTQDDGMDIQTLLELLTKAPGPDGVRALAFAKVDPKNLDEVKAAISIFGSVWTGINVQHQNMADFNAGQPWLYRPGDTVDGGHSVIAGGYGPQAASDVRFVTWGKETSFTDAFWTNLVDEAWVVIWPEHLSSRSFLAGIDQKGLADAYTALTGRPFPGGAPASPDATLADAVRVWASARHSGSNRVAALAVKAWLSAKGL